MVGVTGPRIQRDRTAALVFAGAYSAGLLTSSLLFGVALWVASSAAGPLARPVAGSLVLALGILDLMDRTPTTRRQTPKSWIDRLPFTTVGLFWGLDIGAAVTTIKVTSMLWAALLLSLATSPGTAVLTMLAFALASLTTHWWAALRVQASDSPARAVVALASVSNHLIRRIAGGALVTVGVVVLVAYMEG